MKSQLKLAAAAMLLLTATGCRKELCYDHDQHALACRIALEPEWELEWERDYGTLWQQNWDATQFGHSYEVLRPVKAGGIAVYVYDDSRSETGSQISQEHHIAPDGEMIKVKEGNHRLLMFNDDTHNIILDNMASLPTARATTRARSRSTYAKFHSDEETVGAPDMLFGHFEPLLTTTLTTTALNYPFTMRPLVYTYLVRYVVDEGREYLVSARGALAGMARSVYLTDGRTDNEAATVLYDCELTPWGAESKVPSFGVPGFPDRYYDRAGNTQIPQDDMRHILNLEIHLSTGQSFILDFDVTEQVKKQPRGGVITVSGIRIGGSGPSGGGAFDVNVSDWGPFQDIPLN